MNRELIGGNWATRPLNRIQTCDLFYGLLALYFFTLHADQLSFLCGPYTVRLNNLIALSMLILLCLRFKRSVLTVDKELMKGISFVTVSLLLSFLFSRFKLRCFYFLGMWGLTVIAYILLPYFLMTLGDVRKVLKLYLSSFVCVGVYACLQFIFNVFGFSDPFVTQIIMNTSFFRPNAFAYEPSFFALYMTPIVVMLSLHYWIGKNRYCIVFSKHSTFHIVLIYTFFLISTATTAIFSLLILFLLAFFLPFKRLYPEFRKNFLKFLIYFGSVMLLISIAMPALATKYFFKFFHVGFASHHSFSTRWVGIVNGWHLFLEHPFAGVGLGAMPVHFFISWFQKDPAYTFLIQDTLLDQYVNHFKLFEPSNVGTELLGSLGIVGFLAFSYLLVIFSLKVRRCLQFCNYQVDREWVFLFALSFFITLFVLQFNQGLFRNYIWTHFALGYGFMCRICKENHKQLITNHLN